MNIAIVGAGWAGLAAAVGALQAGHSATVFEATSAIGGRARALKAMLPDGTPVLLDNGQHILIGAYSESLNDGRGIRFPDWPTPLDALGGILGARGWTLADKGSLIRAAVGWQMGRFACAPDLSVAGLCQSLTPRVQTELIEPLCVSALNTPAGRASASVFLRVLRDALFGVAGGSHLLLPKVDLTALFPQPAAQWIRQHGGGIHLKARVLGITQVQQQWQLQLGNEAGSDFDAVIFATSASNTALALTQSALTATNSISERWRKWTELASALRFEAIATVYAWSSGARLSQPMLALRSDAAHPAQFVFDRGALGGPAGLLAFVVSAAEGERQVLQQRVLAQAQAQLGLTLQAVQTVVEKRATFACTPGLIRPPQHIAPGLLACGDHVAGPYPATLEGAVRSGLAAVVALSDSASSAGAGRR